MCGSVVVRVLEPDRGIKVLSSLAPGCILEQDTLTAHSAGFYPGSSGSIPTEKLLTSDLGIKRQNKENKHDKGVLNNSLSFSSKYSQQKENHRKQNKYNQSNTYSREPRGGNC